MQCVKRRINLWFSEEDQDVGQGLSTIVKSIGVIGQRYCPLRRQCLFPESHIVQLTRY